MVEPPIGVGLLDVTVCQIKPFKTAESMAAEHVMSATIERTVIQPITHFPFPPVPALFTLRRRSDSYLDIFKIIAVPQQVEWYSSGKILIQIEPWVFDCHFCPITSVHYYNHKII